MNLLQRLKEILKQEGLNGKDLAELLELKYVNYRSMTRKSAKKFPRWVRGFVIGYELGKQSKTK